jgi:serine/threonine protein kinase
MPLEPGQMLNNRYRIVRLLGQGGFGAVYRAWDVNLDRPCALKENLNTSPEAQRQFNREAILLANLSHPNLPRVTDHFIVVGKGQYLVMDFIEGEDLQSMLHRNQGPLPITRVLTWITQICDALTYLHSQNPPIIHRDIKPANIKIASSGRNAPAQDQDVLNIPPEATHPYLVDFGIAKVFQAHMDTTIGARAVTPGYSPPEQYGQGVTDIRSDVYALGATLYGLLTGQKPTESILRNLGTPTAPPHELNASISPTLEGIIARAMAIIPNDRYQSAMELKSALAISSQPAQMVHPIPSKIAQPVSMPPAETAGRAIPATEHISRTANPWTETPTGGASRRRPWTWIAVGGGLMLASLVLCILLAGALLGSNGNRDATRTALSLENHATSTPNFETPSQIPSKTSKPFGKLPTQPPMLELTNTPPRGVTQPPNLEPAIVEPYCTMFDASPAYVKQNQPVILKWRWTALTEKQVKDHIDSGMYEIFLDGERIKPEGMSDIQYNKDEKYYEVYWYANVGVLSPGKHRAERYLYWLRQISDGWDTYGPGGKIESEYHYCEIIVQ